MFYFVSFMLITLISCGDNNANQKPKSQIDIDKLLEKLQKDGDIDEQTKNKIMAEYNKVKEINESQEQESTPDEIDLTKASKINSLDMFNAIYKDRSLYLENYLNKDIILTDLLVENVSTKDNENGSFVKVVRAFPCNVKTRKVGVENNDLSSPWMYRGVELSPSYELGSGGYIEIELQNADDFKKLNMLEWECNLTDGEYDYQNVNNYQKKISIACRIDRDNIIYEKGVNASDDMKSKDIKITIKGAVIIK